MWGSRRGRPVRRLRWCSDDLRSLRRAAPPLKDPPPVSSYPQQAIKCDCFVHIFPFMLSAPSSMRTERCGQESQKDR